MHIEYICLPYTVRGSLSYLAECFIYAPLSLRVLRFRRRNRDGRRFQWNQKLPVNTLIIGAVLTGASKQLLGAFNLKRSDY